jgi:hypothetical protein
VSYDSSLLAIKTYKLHRKLGLGDKKLWSVRIDACRTFDSPSSSLSSLSLTTPTYFVPPRKNLEASSQDVLRTVSLFSYFTKKRAYKLSADGWAEIVKEPIVLTSANKLRKYFTPHSCEHEFSGRGNGIGYAF